MKLTASFCDPFRSDIIQLGEVDPDTITEKFLSVDWSGYLERMESTDEKDIYYSPSFEIENTDNGNGLSISAVGKKSDFEFYIFYKRPREGRGFLNLTKKTPIIFTSNLTGQTKEDAVECLQALIRNDLDFLENKIR